jgi:hypothetical protein
MMNSNKPSGSFAKLRPILPQIHAGGFARKPAGLSANLNCAIPNFFKKRACGQKMTV